MRTVHPRRLLFLHPLKRLSINFIGQLCNQKTGIDISRTSLKIFEVQFHLRKHCQVKVLVYIAKTNLPGFVLRHWKPQTAKLRKFYLIQEAHSSHCQYRMSSSSSRESVAPRTPSCFFILPGSQIQSKPRELCINIQIGI